METQDGFIIGVYNYCDRWCERCSLASRCRVFAEELRMSLDVPATTTGGDAADGQAPVLRSLGALAAAFEEAIPEDAFVRRAGDALDVSPPWPKLAPADAELHKRVHAVGHRLWAWLAPEARAHEPFVKDAVEVLQHFGIFIGPKIYRALTGREDCEEDGMQSDALGSAKASLLALDRLADTWLRLAEHGVISVLEAAPVLTDLQFITGELERLFPRARDFVRPGFDEPEALALLEWRERG